MDQLLNELDGVKTENAKLVEELEQAINRAAAAEKELEEVKASGGNAADDKLIAELKAENAKLVEYAAELKTALAKAKNEGTIAVPVPGNVTVTIETPKGKKEKFKVRFKAGRLKVMLEDGQLVPSEKLMDLANGKDLDEETLLEFPAFQYLDQKDALEWITHLRSVKSGVLEDVN